MKITKKYLIRLIKEELQKVTEQNFDVDGKDAVKDYDTELSNAVVAGIIDGLKRSKIELQNVPDPVKVVNIRRYKGSGTGLTVDIEVGNWEMPLPVPEKEPSSHLSKSQDDLTANLDQLIPQE